MESNSGLSSRLLWFLSEFVQGLSFCITNHSSKQLTKTISGFRIFIERNHPTKVQQAETLISALQSVAIAIEELLA